MSNNNFIKGECHHCAGHLEFPAAAAGAIIPCPHCGLPTKLVAGTKDKKSNRLVWVGIILTAVVTLNAVAAVYFFVGAPRPRAAEPPKPAAAPTPAPTVPIPPAPPVAAPHPPPPRVDEEQTNDFGISPLILEKTAGSSLVYVTGTVRNLASRQRFGVKIEFQLFDPNDQPIGRATDYQSVLEPWGDWGFKALVMESKAVSARFSAIKEDP